MQSRNRKLNTLSVSLTLVLFLYINFSAKEYQYYDPYVNHYRAGLSPKSFSAAAFIEHMGVFYTTTIGFLASFTTPAPYVSCIGQAAFRDFDKENTLGSGTAKFEGSCRASGTDRLCCGLKNPHALLLQVATSLSFPLPVVMPFVGFSGIIFGESPVTGLFHK
jgi:hypothetical protein